MFMRCRLAAKPVTATINVLGMRESGVNVRGPLVSPQYRDAGAVKEVERFGVDFCSCARDQFSLSLFHFTVLNILTLTFILSGYRGVMNMSKWWA